MRLYITRRFRLAQASPQSDQSSLPACRKLGSLVTHCEHSKACDYTGGSPGLTVSPFGGATDVSAKAEMSVAEMSYFLT